jgi:uncharacterized protein
MGLVFDCNVLVRALLTETSFSGQSLAKAKSMESVILMSSAVFTETIEVIMRPKFDRYVSLEIRERFLEELKLISTDVAIIQRVKACRDPKDDKYLELALSGKANFIITNDEDLLALNPFGKTPIITPLEFLEGYSSR